MKVARMTIAKNKQTLLCFLQSHKYIIENNTITFYTPNTITLDKDTRKKNTVKYKPSLNCHTTTRQLLKKQLTHMVA